MRLCATVFNDVQLIHEQYFKLDTNAYVFTIVSMNNNIKAVASEFGMSVEQFRHASEHRSRLPGQLPNRDFYEEQDEGAERCVDLCLNLNAMRESPAWKRIQRAAKFLDQPAKEFVTHSIMEMVRTCEEDMILSPRTGKLVGDWGDIEDRQGLLGDDWLPTI